MFYLCDALMKPFKKKQKKVLRTLKKDKRKMRSNEKKNTKQNKIHEHNS